MAARYGIPPEEVLIFGDGCNDRSLFRAFVRTRAMGNGDPALQALAERVIASGWRRPGARPAVSGQEELLLFCARSWKSSNMDCSVILSMVVLTAFSILW